ncbi:MAG: formylmethanofuran--tetrahydromethanopterin N-formyltransferase [Fuerstiella sp.]
MMSPAPMIDDTFAEAFPMMATRLMITAADEIFVKTAATEFCGNASSVIGCDCEAAVEQFLTADETIDGRPGVSILAFAFDQGSLQKAVSSRVGQNVLTCPTTACYAGLPASQCEKKIKVGALLRYFGDGYQFSKKLDDRRFWRLPVMDGEFVCEDQFGIVKGVGGGNLILTAADQATAIQAARQAVEAIDKLPDVIMPFPGGLVRSGSKVGSKYATLRASTNHLWCPTLKGECTSDLQPAEMAVYEIVIDGLSEAAVANAMKVGCESLKQHSGVIRISAGNYGGKLGPFHFHLHRLAS